MPETQRSKQAPREAIQQRDGTVQKRQCRNAREAMQEKQLQGKHMRETRQNEHCSNAAMHFNRSTKCLCFIFCNAKCFHTILSSVSTLHIYCALGPTLAASMIYMCIFQLNDKKHAERRTLFENGEMAVTLPTAALSGCGFGSLRCET